MEKQIKHGKQFGRKRQRQSSFTEVTSEPKNLANTPNFLDTLTSSTLTLEKSPLTKENKNKLMTKAKKIITEKSKLDGPNLTKEKVKKKVSKEKLTKNVHTVESVKQKKIKHTEPAAPQPEIMIQEVDMHKKKKKNKEVVLESQKPQKQINTILNIEDTTSALHQHRVKYPILTDTQLIERFLKVPMSNNQKGRIRQALRLSLQDTTNKMLPDIINEKILSITQGSKDLSDSDLRRIRILYNMLKTALESPGEYEIVDKCAEKKKVTKMKKGLESGDKNEEQLVKKIKGPKRYVVFLGNLPLDISKEMIMNHFKDLHSHIKDVRLVKRTENTKSAIAFMELNNEPGYELALSKHHSMMGNKRIRVLYTTQQNSKISKSEAKAKSAKLIALQKSGKLLGSTPLTKKRSHRRAIMKKALANQAAVA